MQRTKNEKQASLDDTKSNQINQTNQIFKKININNMNSESKLKINQFLSTIKVSKTKSKNLTSKNSRMYHYI